jgi:hypothetical protein
MCYFKLWWVVESPKSGPANVWHAALTPVSFFNFLCPTRVSIVWIIRVCVCVCVCARVYIYIYIYMYIYIHTHTHTHTHIWVETAYELPLVPYNTASETFLHKSGAVRSVDWLVIIGAPTLCWLGEYVTLDKAFYSLLFKQEVVVVAARVTSKFPSLSHSFIRNISTLCINYIIIICPKDDDAVINNNYGPRPYFAVCCLLYHRYARGFFRNL